MTTPSASPRIQRLTLIASGLGFVVVLLDVSVVNVALHALHEDLNTGVTGLQWIVNAYNLMFAALLLSAGALGDRLGAKRVFVSGFAIFTIASLACGLAHGLPFLIAARFLQGLGAALLVPNSLSLLRQVFTDTTARSHAVGWWSAAGGIALAAGPVLGGLLIAHFGWRSVFLINLPIGLLGIALTLHYAPVSPRRSSEHLDAGGQIAAIVALVSLTAALSEIGRLGLWNAWTAGGLILFLAATTAFIKLEARSPEPMLPVELFRSSIFSVANIVGIILNFAYYGLIFVFSLYFQAILHFSPLQTGLAFLPMTGVLMAMNVAAGRLIARMGAKRLMIVGLAMAAAGYGWLMPLEADQAYVTLVIPMLLAAAGVALVVPTMTNVILSAVDAPRAGIASGALNSARQIGGVLGVASCGLLIDNLDPAAFMRGMHESLIIAVVLLIIGISLCQRYLPSPERAAHNSPEETEASDET
jgi:DHA2 family methylenomycin A resistance protein-like MFS transporter